MCGVIWVGRIRSDSVSAVLTGGAHKDWKTQTDFQRRWLLQIREDKKHWECLAYFGKLARAFYFYFVQNFFLSKDVLAAESKSLNICHFFSYVHGEDQSKPKKYLAGFSKLLPPVVLRA